MNDLRGTPVIKVVLKKAKAKKHLGANLVKTHKAANETVTFFRFPFEASELLAGQDQ